MTTNHFERKGISAPAVYNQQFFVVCGPIPENKSPADWIRKLWRGHSLSVSVVGVFGLFLLGSWWGAMNYPGATELLKWRCELLAGILSLLTISLFRTFRRWDQERAERGISQQQAQRETGETVSLLLCTPPPLSDEATISTQPEFSITIEQWKSQTATPASEAFLYNNQIPDEIIAPDALVLNFEIREAV